MKIVVVSGTVLIDSRLVLALRECDHEIIPASQSSGVNTALACFDQGEVITIPSLPDAADWAAYERARLPNLSLSSVSARYKATAAAA